MKLTVCLLLTFGFSQSLLAQEAQPRRYVELPLPANIEEILWQNLQQARKIPELDNLIQQWIDKKGQISPQLQKMLEEIAQKAGKGKVDLPLDQLQEIQERLRKEIPDLPRPIDPPAFQGERPPQIELPRAPEEMNLDDRFNEWLLEWFKELQENENWEEEFADWLKNSPAFQEAIKDLSRHFERSGQKLWNPLEKLDWGWVRDIRLRGDWMKLNLPNLPRPQINLRLGNLRFNLPGLPRLPRWGGGGPSFSNSSDILPVLGWLLLLGLIAYLFYQMGGPAVFRSRISKSQAGAGGPPLEPREISSRADLIQAFHFLAYHRLGQKVRFWNHRTIVERLAQGPDLSPAMLSLAELYEKARYTPGQDLSPEEIRLARDQFRLLRGGVA